MALWNLFVLNQYRSSCFCGSLIPCVSCWLHLSWHCIIHPAIPEYWHPMILSKVVAMRFWMMTTHASLICVWRKMWMIIHFWSSYMYYLKFYSGSRLQHIFQPHLLFNFLGCTPCISRMWSILEGLKITCDSLRGYKILLEIIALLFPCFLLFEKSDWHICSPPGLAAWASSSQ